MSRRQRARGPDGEIRDGTVVGLKRARARAIKRGGAGIWRTARADRLAGQMHTARNVEKLILDQEFKPDIGAKAPGRAKLVPTHATRRRATQESPALKRGVSSGFPAPDARVDASHSALGSANSSSATINGAISA
jgi:hypothetical protein